MTLLTALGRSGVTLIAMLAACGLGHADDTQSTIVVAGDVNHAAVHELQKARGRTPTREELLALHRVWIDNEILYREGLKLAGGTATTNNREQVIESALATIDRRVRPSSVPEEELRRWFDSHRDRYEQPARFDFEDASPPGQPSEATVRALTEKLNADPSAVPEDLRVFKARPESNLQQSYGSELTEALAQATPGKWLALQARDGWRAMRLVALVPMSHADLATQRDAVRRDWIEEQVSEKRAAAVQALWKSYKIELAPPFVCHAES